MPTTLTEFDDTAVVEDADPNDPGQDITAEDLGEDKELNASPDMTEEDPDQAEPEADKPEAPAPDEKKEEPVKDAPKAAPTDADKTTEEILKHLGMDSTLKIKGKEYKLADFAKEDLLSMVQKGARMTQIGQELSAREKLLMERERVAEANAIEATRILTQYRTDAPSGANARVPATEPPDALKPSEYDTEEVKAVKVAALGVWKQSRDQAQRLNDIEGGLKSQQTEVESQKFMDELGQHKADFPLASVEEVIAVHALRPDIPLSDLVRRSHGIYGSVEHVKEVFKHSPEVRKQVEDEVIADYLAKNSRARVIPMKPSVQGSRPAPATAPNKVRTIDDAGREAKRRIVQLARELEGDND